MEFLKKHYEKVLFGLVLLGLALAVAFLPWQINSERQKLEDLRNQLTHRQVKPLPAVDLSAQENSLKRLAVPALLDLSTTNKLFNPMKWQRAPDGHLVKVDEHNIGPAALKITKLTPLWLRITLDSLLVSDSGVRYTIGVKKEADPNPAHRAKTKVSCTVGSKNDTFELVGVQGPPDNPTNLVLKLNDTEKNVLVSTNQAFERIDGYMADLEYTPFTGENKSWKDRRVGSPPLSFNNEEYNIVAISENEVVLSAKSNQKKWTIKLKPPS